MNILKFIKETPIIQIRSEYDLNYTGISIVVVNKRIFARVGKLGSNGWYDYFLKKPNGEIKINDKTFPIKAVIPIELKNINTKINEAFHTKYGQIYRSKNFIVNKPFVIHHILEFILI